MYLQKKYIKKKKVVRRRILSVCMVCCMLLGLCGINLISANAAEEAIKAKPIVLDSTDNTISAQTNEQENEQLTDNVGVGSSQVIDNTNQAAADQNGYTNADQPADQSQNQTNSAQPGNDNIALQSIVNNVESDQMLGKLLAALGLSGYDFNVDNIQAAGIQDRNFAQVIYDSVIADQDNFRADIVIRRLDQGDILDPGTNWNIDTIIAAGIQDGIILSASDTNVASKIKLILSYFSGMVDAEARGIQSLDGVKILRRAWKIDLIDNSITDISGLEQGVGEICPPDSENGYKEYFGDYCRNVYLYLSRNPVTTVFKEMDGRVRLDLGQGDEIKLPELTISYLVTGKEKSGIITPLVPADIVQQDEKLDLSSSGVIIASRLSTLDVGKDDIIEKDDNGFWGIKIKNVKSSGKVIASFPYERALGNWFTGIDTGNTTRNEFGLLANKTINMNLYTNVDIKYTSNGCIRLHKQDEKGNAIEGAEFNLYKCADPVDVVISEDELNPDVAKVYKTNKNGNINVSDLDAGSYYFVETKVPDNYQQEIYGTSYTLTNAEATGTPVSFDIAENDRTARYSLYKATGSAPNTDDVCLATGLKAEADGKVTGYVTENGTYYLVKRDVLEVTTVQKSDVNLTNTTRNVSAWNGDSMGVTNEDGTTSVENITATENSGGFYLKGAVPEKKSNSGNVMAGTGEKTADQLAFSLKDTQSSPFYEATVKWTKSLSEDDENATGKMTYRIKRGDEKDTDKVTYCKDLSEVQEKMQEKIQRLAGVEYRNVSVNVKFGGGYESTDDWSADDSSVPSTTVTNPQKTTLKVYKQNDAGKLLEGAEFTLYRAATDADTDVVEVTVGGVKKKVVAVDKQTTAKESADADKAVATFKELANSSTYYLAETYLPTGHQYIKKDGADYEYATGKVYEVTTDSKGDVFIDEEKAEGESGGHVFSITFTNVGITLPKSGFDGGYTLYTILAMLIITVAGVWLYMNKRKQKINF